MLLAESGRMTRRLALGFFALLALAGCVPNTPYRNAAVVPAARALVWDGRTAEPGTLRVEGGASITPVLQNNFPQLHDSALHVPLVTAEGSAVLAVARGVELGVRVAYASYDWTQTSALGTLDVPSHPASWGIGPEIRTMIPFNRRGRFALGVAGNFLQYNIPYAEWQAVGTCTTITCSGGYQLADEQSESHWALNVAVYPSFLIGEDGRFGHIFLGFSAHTQFANDGFTNVPNNGTVEDAGLIFIGGIGYGIKVGAARFSGMMSIPFTDDQSPVHYGLAGFFTAGIDLALWEPRAPHSEDRQR